MTSGRGGRWHGLDIDNEGHNQAKHVPMLKWAQLCGNLANVFY